MGRQQRRPNPQAKNARTADFIAAMVLMVLFFAGVKDAALIFIPLTVWVVLRMFLARRR